MTTDTIKEHISNLIISKATFEEYYNLFKSYLEKEIIDCKTLETILYETAKEKIDDHLNNTYYYDVVCEVLSSLTGRCETEHSLENFEK